MVPLRLSLCIALLALSPSAATLGGRAASSTPHPPIAGAIEGAYDEELRRFGDLLGRLRSGEEGVRAELESAAERLCAEWGRCDAAGVARYYAGLSSAERARGLLDEGRYQSLRDEVYESGESGVEGEEWVQLRSELIDELRRLAQEVESRADFVPAARAISLCALLEVDQLEQGRELSPQEESELAQTVEADCLRSMEILHLAGHATPQLEPRWLLARVQRFRGQLARARSSFERVRRDAAVARRSEYTERALNGLIEVARDMGDVDEEERLLEELAGFRDPSTCWPLARDWAARMFHADHAERALEFLERNRPSANSPPTDRDEWELLMGSAAQRAGDLERARTHYERLMRTRSRELAQLGLARLHLARGRADEALVQLADDEENPGPREETEAMRRSFLGEARLATGDASGAIAELRAALELADRRGGSLLAQPLFDTGERAAMNVIGEWGATGLHTVALLAQALAQDGQALEAARVIEDYQSRTLRREDEELRRLRAIAGLDVHRTPVTTAQLLAWARSTDCGLITWVVGADSGVVVHVTADGDAFAQRIDYGRSRVQDAARRLRESILAGSAATTARLGREIRDALVPAAVAERLAGFERGARLLVLLHGPMETLPIETLPLRESTFDESLEMVCLPGLPAAHPGAVPRDFTQWRLLGAPTGPGPSGTDLAPLPGAAQELRELAEMHTGALLKTGAAFDRAALRAALAGDACLHVATHLVEACPREQRRFPAIGLALSDGATLCAQEVAEIGPELSLVVLSACETGTGRPVDSHGLQGLARAFLEAGTRNLIVTQWPVEDRAARLFAISFHRFMQQGNGPSSAARAAREELRAAGRPAADWAAFRLLGRD